MADKKSFINLALDSDMMDYSEFAAMCDDSDFPEEWSDEDEAAFEDWEERRRERLAEANEY